MASSEQATGQTERTLGARLYFARVHQGKQSLAAFGAKIAAAEGRSVPYHFATVSEWEHGRRIPSLAVLQAAAKVSGLREEWLILDSGPRSVAA